MINYTETDFAIVRENKDGSVSFIPKDNSNADYQAYLNKDKAEQSTPNV